MTLILSPLKQNGTTRLSPRETFCPRVDKIKVTHAVVFMSHLIILTMMLNGTDDFQVIILVIDL